MNKGIRTDLNLEPLGRSYTYKHFVIFLKLDEEKTPRSFANVVIPHPDTYFETGYSHYSGTFPQEIKLVKLWRLPVSFLALGTFQFQVLKKNSQS